MPKPGNTELGVVRLETGLAARVDDWAQAHGVDRGEAICRLVELGLTPTVVKPRRPTQHDAITIESLVVSQLDRLIDPDTPQDERDRRIHRLTDGPPEFVGLRIDLPGRRPH